MTFKKLATFLDALEKTSSRIEITKILANLFKISRREEIDKTCYLVLGILAPSYKGVVFNLAERMMLDVFVRAYGVGKDRIVQLYKKEGDLGNLAIKLAKESETTAIELELSVTQVYEQLLDIAKEEGEKSVERKIEKMARLLVSLDPLSAKFVARIPVGRLRLGFSDKTILDALSWMETGGKAKKSELEVAFNVRPDVGYLAQLVKEKGIDKSVLGVNPAIGVPMLPMLAQRLKSPREMIEKMKRVYVEPKFDGLRIQIHYKKGGFEDGSKVKTFTRNLNETSWMFPELDKFGKYTKANEVILDTEAIGVDEERKSLANFQTTMTRRRKHDIEKIAAKVSIKFYVFDIMYKDGDSLIRKPYEERRMFLSKSIVGGKLLQVVDYQITDSPEEISRLMQKELKEGMEGIIVKRADSKYIAGRTGWRWVKMKEEEGSKAKLADTIDCIVMGYYRGKGKRTQFGMGGFLVGILDNEEINTVTKIGTGLSDEQFKEMYERLTQLQVKEKPKEYGEVNKLLTPDVWVMPSLVVEIAADEITKSPTHSSGLALRFPRLVKFRDDRRPEDATTLTEIKKLSKLQG